ncbi:MAG TPA: His/Gly/Thr/Pro-type tRNA ligase C-terminal domain-containing protein, partial [Holophagaceae bacterium]|nr:His/Gly/Thr/Pro-type tRNA ligase C-terminal domain-containing protein [Holophagaceae bacterium]
FQVHLLNLDPGNAEVSQVANELESALEKAGFEVLHDEREGLSPGAKFKDADLLGFPLRIMVGSKGLKDGIVELKERRTKALSKLAPGAVVAAVADAKARILSELAEAGGR